MMSEPQKSEAQDQVWDDVSLPRLLVWIVLVPVLGPVGC